MNAAPVGSLCATWQAWRSNRNRYERTRLNGASRPDYVDGVAFAELNGPRVYK